MSAVATPPDLDALEANADQRLEELRDQAQRLSLDALTDPQIVAELDDVRSEVASAERALEQVRLAREESARRDTEAAREAERARRDAELLRARELETERRNAARAVDSALVKFACALKDWDGITTQQEQCLRRAGRDGAAARPRRWMIEGALNRALADARLPHGIISLRMSSGNMLRPLAEADCRPCEPVEGRRGRLTNDQ